MREESKMCFFLSEVHDREGSWQVVLLVQLQIT